MIIYLIDYDLFFFLLGEINYIRKERMCLFIEGLKCENMWFNVLIIRIFFWLSIREFIMFGYIYNVIKLGLVKGDSYL